MLWKTTPTLEGLNALNANTMSEFLGITFTEVGEDYLVATMPVNEKTVQPYGILHGGANVVLAETIGSVASTLCVPDLSTHAPVGLEINANHLKSVSAGEQVTGKCKPIRIGRQIHVWEIEIRNQSGELSCISRLTVTIVRRR